MLLNLKRRAQRSTQALPEPSAQTTVVASVVHDLARKAGDVGRCGAELQGAIEEIASDCNRTTTQMQTLAGEIDDVVVATGAIGTAAENGQSQMREVRGAVARVAEGVTSVIDTLGQVSGAAQEITQIALQTRLVAFNASVEAKRAGEAGRGFSVVAEAVKDLATKVGQSSTQIMTTVEQLDRRVADLAAQITTRSGGRDSAFQSSLAQAERSVAGIAAAAQGNLDACRSAAQRIRTLAAGTMQMAGSLETARAAANRFRDLSEALVEFTAESGCETEDTPYIAAMLAATARVTELFELAVRAGEISLEDLFDENYQPIAGTNPQQYMSRYTTFTDRALPAIIEEMLRFSPKVMLFAAIDRNGYIGTHSAKVSRPQGPDPVWNAANCRNRRIFDDRTGLAAAHNKRKFLLQVYRRDMGGGVFETMKDLSAPIFVQGRHWGGARLAYRF
ncbi:MAG: methyl-accepting chemotaxis protein [Burkholderiaceae bacterium]|nr:methyl-accepting chemotaxis protein [Burkholderiaceae bacterium]